MHSPPPLPLGPAGGLSQYHVQGGDHAPPMDINTNEVQCDHSAGLYTRALRVAIAISLLVIETPGEYASCDSLALASVLQRNGIEEYLHFFFSEFIVFWGLAVCKTIDISLI